MATPARKTGGARARRNPIPANSGARALVEVGDRWSLMILGAAFGGVHRFSDWREQLGIASNILANRLEQLVEAGCLEALPAESGKRIVYRLTPKGHDLYPVALMFWRFDRAWSRRRPLEAAALLHNACGQPMTPRLICAHCREPVRPREVEHRKGPGAGMEYLPPAGNNRRSSAPGKAAKNGLFGESIEVFGDRWTQHLMGLFFLGLRRFEDLRAECHIATNILSDRLRLLVQHGILQRRVYQLNPERSEYLLTPKGLDMYPILLTLNQWGDRWLSPGGPPLLLFHRRCGARLEALAVCSQCEAPLDCHEVTFTPRSPARRS